MKIQFLILIICQTLSAYGAKLNCLEYPQGSIFNLQYNSQGNATQLQGSKAQTAFKFNYIQKQNQIAQNILFGENDITFSFNVKFVSLRNTVDLQYIVNGYNGRNEYKNDEFSILQEGKALKININHETCQLEDLLDIEENTWIHYNIVMGKQKRYIKAYKNGVYQKCKVALYGDNFKGLESEYDYLVFGQKYADIQQSQEKSNFLLEDFLIFKRKLERSEVQCLQDICLASCNNTCQHKSSNCLTNNNTENDGKCESQKEEMKESVEILHRNFELNEYEFGFKFNLKAENLGFDYLKSCPLLVQLEALQLNQDDNSSDKKTIDLSEDLGFKTNLSSGHVSFGFSQEDIKNYCLENGKFNKNHLNLCIFNLQLLEQQDQKLVSFKIVLQKQMRLNKYDVVYIEKSIDNNNKEEEEEKILVDSEICKDGQHSDSYKMDGKWENIFALEVKNDFLKRNFMMKMKNIVLKGPSPNNLETNISIEKYQMYDHLKGISVHKLEKPEENGKYILEMEAEIDMNEFSLVFGSQKIRKLKKIVELSVVDDIGYYQNSYFSQKEYYDDHSYYNNYPYDDYGYGGWEDSGDDDGKTGILIGGSIGGFVVLVIFICFFVRYRRNRNTNSNKLENQDKQLNKKQISPTSTKDYEKNSDGFDYYKSLDQNFKQNSKQKREEKTCTVMSDQEWQKYNNNNCKLEYICKQKSIEIQQVQISSNDKGDNPCVQQKNNLVWGQNRYKQEQEQQEQQEENKQQNMYPSF